MACQGVRGSGSWRRWALASVMTTTSSPTCGPPHRIVAQAPVELGFAGAANAAIFDAANAFRGCIPGIHEVLRRAGLLAGRWCLDPGEELSPGQAAEIDRVCAAYPS